jgi:glycosyltransferase involved in cell wall biosynthesis
MKVAIETSCLLRGRAGVAVMTRELLDALQLLPSRPELRMLSPSLKIRHLGKVAAKMDTLWNDLLWLEHSIPRQLRDQKIDLFHAPHPYFPRTIPVPWMVTVHDIYVKHHPECFRPWAAKSFRQREKGLSTANQIVCDSHFTRDELLNAVPAINADRVEVVHLGASPSFRPVPEAIVRETLKRYGVHHPYFLVVGTVEPRKNILPLVSNFEKGLPGKTPTLVMVGADGWIPSYLDAVNKSVAQSTRILRLGHVGDVDLAALYSGAEAFLYPSLYEGFGMPVLEAMRCGCPVICSRGSSLDEVCGGHALQLDAKDTDAWIEALRERTTNPAGSRLGVDAARKWAESFTWAKTAEQYCNIYQRVIEHAQ